MTAKSVCRVMTDFGLATLEISTFAWSRVAMVEASLHVDGPGGLLDTMNLAQDMERRIKEAFKDVGME